MSSRERYRTIPLMRDPRDDIEDHRPDAPAGLYFSRRGNWFHDGQRVRHERLAELLCRSVARLSDDTLAVTTGRDTLPFLSEDAPLLVRAIDFGLDGPTLVLSNGGRELLAGEVVVGGDGRWRMSVENGRFWALCTRSAQQALEPLLVDEEHLQWRDQRWRIAVAASAEHGAEREADPTTARGAGRWNEQWARRPA